MNYKSFIAGAMAFALAACAAGCSDKKSSDSKQDNNKGTIAPTETTAAEETTEELLPPVPVEATDPNTVTFDDGIFDFVTTRNEDKDCASGTISVVELMGNKMLRFADDNTVPLDGKVQKVIISATKLLGNEGAAKVRSIEFDMYAQATADHLKTDDADGVRAPGWIGGGGGTVTAKDNKWYDFKEFSGGEYNFETSGNVHAVFKFLLADDGQCWTEEMEDANFLIMRWGIANESDMYIDNIVFYDEDGKSIPLAYQKSKMEQLEGAASQMKAEIEEKAEEAKAEFNEGIEKVKTESEKAREEMKAEYEKAVADMKAKFENASDDIKNSEEYEKVKAKIAEAEARISEGSAKAKEAYEEASKAFEESRNNQ